jgi:hypothetical protein
VSRSESTGALKSFIKIVGLLLLVLGAGLAFEVMREWFGNAAAHGFTSVMILGLFPFALCGAISFMGWRIYRYWSPEAIAEYAAVQALFTGIAIGGVSGFFLNHWGSVIGTVVFLILLRVLKTFLLRHLGFAPEHSDVAAEAKSVDEVAGTPWQNNPGYTGR